MIRSKKERGFYPDYGGKQEFEQTTRNGTGTEISAYPVPKGKEKRLKRLCQLMGEAFSSKEKTGEWWGRGKGGGL